MLSRNGSNSGSTSISGEAPLCGMSSAISRADEKVVKNVKNGRRMQNVNKNQLSEGENGENDDVRERAPNPRETWGKQTPSGENQEENPGINFWSV